MPKHAGRCRTIARTWEVWLMLAEGPRTIDELAGAVNVTTRTIRRDLAALEAAGVTIFDDACDDGRRRWRVVATRIPDRRAA